MNAAWTPAIRPSEASHGPTHARLDGTQLPSATAPLVERMALAPPPNWTSEVVEDPLQEPWREQLAGLDDLWPAGPTEVAADPLDLPPPPPPSVVAGLLARPGSRRSKGRRKDGAQDRATEDGAWAETIPLALVPRQRAEEPNVHPLETPPQGLRKFDLGTVPASVTPPRTWRKAAWFAVSTSAAVVCGLALAAVWLVGPPWQGDSIDSLPAYPTRPLEIEQLPVQETSDSPPVSGPRRTESSASEKPAPGSSSAPRESGSARPVGSPVGTDVPRSSAADADRSPAGSAEAAALSAVSAPQRTTVGPEPVTPTAPQAMGDRTEEYFALVTKDPKAAHALCSGHLAEEGPAAIEARYRDVSRVEVQRIVIDRNHAITTSTVKVVYKNGTEAIEKRRLTFTWGSDPRISDEIVTSG